MTWRQLTERYCRECKLSKIDLHDRDTWRSVVISAICHVCSKPATLKGGEGERVAVATDVVDVAVLAP